MELTITVSRLTRVRQEIAKYVNSEDLKLDAYLGSEIYSFENPKPIPVVINGNSAECEWVWDRNNYKNIVRFDIDLAAAVVSITSKSYIDRKLIDLNLVKVAYTLDIKRAEIPESYKLNSQYGNKHNRFSLITVTSRSHHG